MADNNEVIKALGQVPELVEKTERVLEDSDKKFRILAEAFQKRMQAEIPSSEVDKVANAAVAAVNRTKCASPNTDEVSRLVAENIARAMNDSVKSIITEAAKEAIDGMSLKVEHFHTHTTLKYMCQFAETKIRNLIVCLATYSLILSIIGIFAIYKYTNSDKYLGAQYAEIYFSKYTTASEQKMLNANTYTVGFMPQEFNRNPELVKQKIKNNLQIIKQREAEARANKGKFLTKIPLER